MVTTIIVTTLQIFVYSIGLILVLTLILLKPQTIPSVAIRTVIFSVCFFRPIILAKFLEDKFFILSDFVLLCLSGTSLAWTHSMFPTLFIQCCNNSFGRDIATLSHQAIWVTITVCAISFLTLEVTFYCVITLATSDLGYYGLLHNILWIVPEKVAVAIQRLAEKVRTAAATIAVAGIGAAVPLGVVGGAIVQGVIVVAAGIVQGASEVAHGVENVMAACRNDAESTLEEEDIEASSPPPYCVSIIILLLIVFPLTQDLII
jgi:hypothetical protein